LSPTGSQFSYQTTSDLGTFSPTSTFTSPYIGLIATGYYFDEVVNATSTGTVTLNGYSDLSVDSVLNVNLLTTLTYQRIQNLVTTANKPFDAARAQAESEVLAAFNIPAGSYSAFSTFSTLDLGADTDGSHILAALSSIFVNGNSAGPLSVLIAKVQSDIGTTGVIDATTASALATSEQSINPATVAGNLSQEYASVGVTFTATDLSNWIDQNGDGLIGLFRFPVRLATPASTFTFPAFVVTLLVGTSASAVTVSAGQLSITTSGGAKETGAIQASDLISVTPGAAGLPNGVLNSYLMNGTNNVALVIFAAQPSWHQAGDLPALRTQQTATLLSNGQVLVAGGLNPTPTATIFIAPAELYNPTGTWWAPAGQLAVPRDAHTATLLGNGQVLVAGGVAQTGYYASISELYNPATNVWSAAPGLATPRSNHTASLLPNGNVLVVGGNSSVGTSLASAELYNPVSNTWSAAASLATARVVHTATILANGDVLVVGGSAYDGTLLASAELYDPVANTWSPAGTLATARAYHTATLLSNGSVLVAGGISSCSTCSESIYLVSAELYNPATNSWSTVAAMSIGRAGHTATLLAGGTVLVTGGTTQNATQPVTATTEIYDPVANTWTLGAAMSTPRTNHSANLLSGGAVLVEGGDSDTAALASAEYYW
jgi:N-acetylneuraminic acid mutarotase